MLWEMVQWEFLPQKKNYGMYDKMTKEIENKQKNKK
jgi:hypothetical protein